MRGRYGRTPREQGAPFTHEELFFFRVPRTWPDILERFGRTSRVLDAILEADCYGRGFLDWSARTRCWYLNEAGKAMLLGASTKAAS